MCVTFHFFFLKISKLNVVDTENNKNVPMISCLKVGLHVINHSICFVSVKCSEPVLPYLLSSSHFLTLQFLSFPLSNFSKET